MGSPHQARNYCSQRDEKPNGDNGHNQDSHGPPIVRGLLATGSFVTQPGFHRARKSTLSPRRRPNRLSDIAASLENLRKRLANIDLLRTESSDRDHRRM